MDTAITLVTVALSAFSVTITIFIWKINRRDKKLQKIAEGRIVEYKYMRATGSVAYHTAHAVSKTKIEGKPICNGEVEGAMRYYKDKEHDLEDYYQREHAVNNAKGA